MTATIPRASHTRTATTRILGVGSALPGRDIPGAVLTNARLSELMLEARDWMRERGYSDSFPISTLDFPEERLGVRERRVLDEKYCVRDLAVEAARRALESSGVDPRRVAVVLVSTVTPHDLLPAVATVVQGALSLRDRVAAFDVNLGCSGFAAALDTASSMLSVESENAKQGDEGDVALVIAAEAMTRVLDLCDRTTCPVFGDAAGAVVIERYGRDAQSSWTTLGALGERIEIRAPEHVQPVLRIRSMNGDLHVDADRDMRRSATMAGSRVFKEMVLEIPRVLVEFLEEQRLSFESVEAVIFHQANRRMLDAIARDRRLDLQGKVPCNIEGVANTSSASIPVLLEELHARQGLRAGAELVLVGFGAGYSIILKRVAWACGGA